MAALRSAGVLLLWYATSWLSVYFVVMGLDSRNARQYFVLGWSFSGGELPTFIWFVSLVVFAVGAIVLLALRRPRRREVTH